MRHYYFDHNATTPVDPEVLSGYSEALGEVYGNASSIHHFGQAAKQRLEKARRQVAVAIGAKPKEIVFVSGGTEADNLALRGMVRAGQHLVTTAIEHPAVLNVRDIDVTYVRVGSDGIVDPDDIRGALRPNTVLVSVMHANNEIGTIQPLAEISKITRETGVHLHSDGVQALGKIPVNVDDLGVDLYSISGHKINAPKGIGALYVREKTPLSAMMFGGHHERERRPGTENVPGAAALGIAVGRTPWSAQGPLALLRDHLENRILTRIPHTSINGNPTHRLPNTTNISFDGIEGEALLIALDLRGFSVSSGSACSSGAVEPSHVLTAIGLTPSQARSSLRFSLGHGNTLEQVNALIEAVADSVTHLRRISTEAHAYA